MSSIVLIYDIVTVGIYLSALKSIHNQQTPNDPGSVGSGLNRRTSG
jgi:hypothetical protein